MKLYMNNEDMNNEDINNEDIYVEIKNPTLCIICLEELDDNIKNICVNCNIKCHTKCLRKWYKSKRKHICPICLKTKRYYEKKKIENNEIETETQNISIVLNEENNIDYISEDELNEEEEEEMDEEETGEEEVINYYLHRQNDRNICYRTVNELCCSKRRGSYLLIFCIIMYAYSITF